MTAKKTSRNPGRTRPVQKTKPIILVLETSGASSRLVRRMGGNTVQVAPTDLQAVEDALDDPRGIDGLLLTGGGDLDPRLYGKTRIHKKVYGVSETRDLVETIAMDRADEAGLPVLGICRGHQFINVYYGGTLHQDIADHKQHHYGRHAVRVKNNTMLRRAAGKERPMITSYHHQAVRNVAGGFVVSAKDADGTVEAIESEDGLIMGVQFHPEMDSGASHSQGIFRWLVVAAADKAGLVAPLPQSWQPVVAKDRRVWTMKDGKRVYATVPARQSAVRAHNEAVRRPAAQPPLCQVAWFCPSCSTGGEVLRFDVKDDFLDHMQVLHGVPWDAPAEVGS